MFKACIFINTTSETRRALITRTFPLQFAVCKSYNDISPQTDCSIESYLFSIQFNLVNESITTPLSVPL